MRIGLDIDGVLCNFTKGVWKRADNLNLGHHFPKCNSEAEYWDLSIHFSHVMKDAWMDKNFWLELEPLSGMPQDIPFQPIVYITSRPIATEVTIEWLTKHNFPEAPVVTVRDHLHKLKWYKKYKLDLFVDDRFDTVQAMLDANLPALLYRAPYQRGHIEECKHLPTIDRLEEILDENRNWAYGHSTGR